MTDKEMDMDEKTITAYALGVLFGMTDNEDEEQLAHDAYSKVRDSAAHGSGDYHERVHNEQVLFAKFHQGIREGTSYGQEKRDQWNLYRKDHIARKAQEELNRG